MCLFLPPSLSYLPACLCCLSCLFLLPVLPAFVACPAWMPLLPVHLLACRCGSGSVLTCSFLFCSLLCVIGYTHARTGLSKPLCGCHIQQVRCTVSPLLALWSSEKYRACLHLHCVLSRLYGPECRPRASSQAFTWIDRSLTVESVACLLTGSHILEHNSYGDGMLDRVLQG